MLFLHLPANVKCCFGIIRAAHEIWEFHVQITGVSSWAAQWVGGSTRGAWRVASLPGAHSHGTVQVVPGLGRGGVGAGSPHTAESNVLIVR